MRKHPGEEVEVIEARVESIDLTDVVEVIEQTVASTNVPAHLQKLKSGQTVFEEQINTWTHGFGLFASAVGFLILLGVSLYLGEPLRVFALTLYGITLMMTFTTSTLYHGHPDGARKVFWQKADHISIYFLIAGSYTPFALLVLNEDQGMSLLWLMWSLVLVGTIYKSVALHRFPTFSLALYLLMGWSGLWVAVPLYNTLPPISFTYLVLGGAAYTVGAFFFAYERIPYHHCIWHLFVLAGAAFHFFSIYLAVM